MLAPSTLGAWAALAALAICAPAAARPSAPAVVCASAPDAPACAGGAVACATCHDALDPPRWNAYGSALRAALDPALPFEQALGMALRQQRDADADGDGASNADELNAGSSPGSASEKPAGTLPPAGDNPAYALDGYDVAFAYRRVVTLYCGRSPSYEEMRELRDAPEPRALIHTGLSACLESAYWLQQALPGLADKRIKPVYTIGADSPLVFNGIRAALGDYRYDYRLWVHVLSGDRDMRDLLTADYHIALDEQGKPYVTRENLPRPLDAIAGGQPLWAEYRAGMITTQWFLSVNTMLSGLPRVTAAQAYRAYLGSDISNSEGLMPVPGEPLDVDAKGVAAPRCAVCHSTLDPLAYAFMPYEGERIGTQDFGTYSALRPKRYVPHWDESKPRAHVLGQPVSTLVEWGARAADSDAFKRNLAEMFFVHALGRKPLPSEQAEFSALWRSCAEDGHSANRMLHRLVDTDSFGAP